MSHFLSWSLIAFSHHLDLCLDRITIVGSLITNHKTTYLILAPGRMFLRISLSLLISKRSVSPAYLSIFRITIRIDYPHEIRKSGSCALRTIHCYHRHLGDGAINSGCRCHGWQTGYTYQ